jgi:hypothetical protein
MGRYQNRCTSLHRESHDVSSREENASCVHVPWTRGGCRGISQLYRSPDTTHLVGNLKSQVREMQQTRDQLTSELTALQKSTRATKVGAGEG